MSEYFQFISIFRKLSIRKAREGLLNFRDPIDPPCTEWWVIPSIILIYIVSKFFPTALEQLI